MSLSRSILPALVAGLLATGAAHAQTPQVAVENAWSRATPPGASTGAFYVTLTSPQGDKLVGASSPASRAAEVHEMSMDGSVMRMRQITGGLDLPPGRPIALQPGGYHIMLVGLKAPLRQGQTVQVHLSFANAPPMDVTARIAAIGASTAPGAAASPAPAAGSMGGMPGMSGMSGAHSH